ncbi:ethanolamine ammonia-lyase subunit EutC [Nocardioides sp. 31GB23]|uniref:Ethanolamine ammonia-lyase small subunit n=1 Tax=Nocardioides salarius TaxID=374513 RepID=A0ABS2M9R1_9ACTN|nr:ethanolamine ammonia-lyase subunit EutC [Nocardioides salarius]MBM7507901.1 ethanolamine ammonia-lyase small subunit [Nocardioides salarius]
MSGDFWAGLRGSTPARIGLHRTGDALDTPALLSLGAAHALARDAVHRPLDVESVTEQLRGLGLGEPVVVRSAAPDRRTYLARPDLGRRPSGDLAPARGRAVDLAVVVADGLSSEAVERHATPLLGELVTLLPGLVLASPVVATQARVALGDHVGAHLGAALVLVLIGERPGLSSTDSLGAYLTWEPRPGLGDAARNCVSNIRPPHGLDYPAAARVLSMLVAGARRLGATGVHLKDRSGAVAPGGTTDQLGHQGGSRSPDSV